MNRIVYIEEFCHSEPNWLRIILKLPVVCRSHTKDGKHVWRESLQSLSLCCLLKHV